MFDMLLQSAGKKVDALSPAQLHDTPMDDIVEHIVDSLRVESLTIYEESKSRDQQEIQIDVQGWPGRATFRDGPCMVSGIKLVISLPFSGDSGLWKLQPSSYMLSVHPHGTVLGSNLEMVFEQPIDVPPETFLRELEENLKTIRQYLKWQEEEIEK